MQVDPNNRTFGNIEALPELNAESEAAFAKLVAEGKVIAISDEKKQLEMLQTSLRASGFVGVDGA